MKKNSFFILAVFLLFVTGIPVWAASDNDAVYINPVYAKEKIQIEQPYEDSEECVGASETMPYYSNAKKAGAYLKEKMLGRVRNIQFRTYSTEPGWRGAFQNILDEAWEASDETASDEGDYLRWHFYSFQLSSAAPSQTAAPQGGYYYTISGVMTYMSTAREENWVKSRINSLLTSTLRIYNMKTEYDKIRAIYQYVTKTVKYDYSENDDLGKYSAYNALNGKAVCQGYANLIYRMLREAGLSSRFIGGTSRGEGHAWNIARIRGRYYNLDATWDAGFDETQYRYFLKGAYDFPNHTRDEEYLLPAFTNRYRMSEFSYQAGNENPIVYKITYFLNGGTNAKKNPSSYFGNAVHLEKPQRAGYLFDGWYTDKGFTKEITMIPRSSAKNYVLYAKWTRIGLARGKILTYKADGTGLRIGWQKVKDTEGYQLAYSHYSSFPSGKTKYVYVKANKLGRLIRLKDASKRYYVRIRAYRTDSTGKKTWGKYSPAVSGYRVQYRLKGGRNHELNAFYYYKRGMTLKNPVRKGYRFKGWYKDARCTKRVKKIYASGRQHMILYAKWEKIGS